MKVVRLKSDQPNQWLQACKEGDMQKFFLTHASNVMRSRNNFLFYPKYCIEQNIRKTKLLQLDYLVSICVIKLLWLHQKHPYPCPGIK